MTRLFGEDIYKEFAKILSKARKEAKCYINHDNKGIDKKELYDFHEIDAIYKEMIIEKKNLVYSTKNIEQVSYL